MRFHKFGGHEAVFLAVDVLLVVIEKKDHEGRKENYQEPHGSL
jgi:hypothetical protein